MIGEEIGVLDDGCEQYETGRRPIGNADPLHRVGLQAQESRSQRPEQAALQRFVIEPESNQQDDESCYECHQSELGNFGPMKPRTFEKCSVKKCGTVFFSRTTDDGNEYRLDK